MVSKSVVDRGVEANEVTEDRNGWMENTWLRKGREIERDGQWEVHAGQ